MTNTGNIRLLMNQPNRRITVFGPLSALVILHTSQYTAVLSTIKLYYAVTLITSYNSHDQQRSADKMGLTSSYLCGLI